MEKYITVRLRFCLITLLFGLFLAPQKAMAATTQSIHDLLNSSQYNLRFTGPEMGGQFGYNVQSADIDGNGKQDIVVSAIVAGRFSSPLSNGYVYVIYDSLIGSYSGTGNTIDLSNSANYNLLFRHSSQNAALGERIRVADIDNDGKQDLLIGAYDNDYGFADAGSLYVIYNSLFSTHTGTGNVIDLANSVNYNLRFNGDTDHAYFARIFDTGDIDNDGKTDIYIVSGGTDHNSRPDSGTVYVIKNSLINSYIGTGHNFSMIDPANYNLRFDGAFTNTCCGSSSSSGFYITTVDLNGNSKEDILLSAVSDNNNSRTASGSLYVIYDNIISGYTGTGNNIDLVNSANYNVRFDGASAEDAFSSGAITGLLDNNSKLDILANAYATDYNSRSDSGSLYTIYDSILNKYSGTGNNVDLANSVNYNVRFDGASAGEWFSYAEPKITDFDSDGKQDIIAGAISSGYNSRSNSGSVYIINNNLFSGLSGTGNDFNMSDTTNYVSRLDGGAIFDHLGHNVVAGDMNNDGKPDLIASAVTANYNNQSFVGFLYVIYNFPHSLSLNTINSLTNNNSIVVTGDVTATQSVTNIKGVQYSLDNSGFSGTWNDCVATDGAFDSTSESFTCAVSISGLTDGSHTVRFRAYDDNISYTAISNYASASFTYDHTSPKVDWTDTSGNSKKYESQGGDNVYTKDTLPTFTFSKSSDSTSGLTRYEIWVDGNRYITNIDPNKPGDKDYREDDDKYVKYEGDNNISVHAKKDSDKLVSGKAYKWKVRAVDQAGNSTDTAEKILRINTHEANFSGAWFPLTLLNIGGKDINFSSINSSLISDLKISSLTPTFYGIAPVGTKVILKIEKENDSKTGRDLVFTTTSSANESSRFGINVTDKLEKQEYFINLSAVNLQGDYVELPEFKLNIGGTGIFQKIEEIIKQKQSNPTPTKKGNYRLDPRLRGDDTGTSIGLKNNKTAKKHCFLWMCW